MKHKVICSNCFRDEGLRLNAIQIGYEDNSLCRNCGSKDGYKLTKDLIEKLCFWFFVRGSITRLEYGETPIIQCHKYHIHKSDVELSDWLIEDVKLIENIGGISIFYYGPRLWMLGEIEPLQKLQDITKRAEIIDEILKKYPSRELTTSDYFYRIRTNPSESHKIEQYDSAPDCHLGKNRLDSQQLPILYGSQDLDVCIHECRISVEDDIFVGTLVPKRTLKLLDLTELIEEDNVTEFESLDMAIHFLFLAGKHSYDICREIAIAASKSGFDGIIYPSYFSYFRTGNIPFETVYGISIRKIASLKSYAKSQIIENLALFGRPIEEGKVDVRCINKVLLNKIDYKKTFGPIIEFK